MQYRTLGRTGLHVSAVSMGTWKSFDAHGRNAVERVAALVTEAVRCGVNLFDTAPMYGEAEAVLGQALRGRREGVLIATKVLAHDPRSARAEIEASFRKLQVDIIDLLQIHNLAAWREITPVLEEFKTKGRVRFLGVTDYRTSMFPELMRAMRTGAFDTIQIPYNVGERLAEREVLPLARELNIGVLVMTPLCPIFDRSRLLRVLQRHDLTFLHPHGATTPGQALLAYLLNKARDVVLLPATSKIARVQENSAVGDNPPLPDDVTRQLEAFFA